MTFAWTLVRLLLSPAEACGGFACDSQPILQAAERIVFGVDETSDAVEMHVQITFTGSADDFAWIVPVPDVPDLFLTTGLLFNQVAVATTPTFTLRVIEQGSCQEEDGGESTDTIPTDVDGGGDSYDDAESGGSWDVTVVGSEGIGPYETVTLAADSAEDLLGWLAAEGYDLPENFEEVLAPYVSRGAYFVALKLAADRDTGDLAPLGLRFEANKAMVPVQLTSISATPDMRMEAYVFAEGRGVPESYFHLRINPIAIDWWNAGNNYDDVVTQAANEAGGHGFATDYFGSSAIVPTLYGGSYDEAALRAAPDAFEWADRIRRTLNLPPPELFQVLEDQLPLPPGSGAGWWSCPGCSSSTYSSSTGSDEFPEFDVERATDDLIARVYEPLEAAQGLLDRYPKLARMSSSLDAIEMTTDPVFVVNHDLRGVDVPKDYTATMYYDCTRLRTSASEADRLLEIEGFEIPFPSEQWISENGTTDFEYLKDLRANNAIVIEQMGAEGDPTVVTDHRGEIAELIGLLNRPGACGGNRGCSTVGGGATLILGALTVLVARRRTPRVQAP